MPEATPTLLPHDECDKLALRLQHAVTGFVDEPRSAVEQVDQVVEEITGRFTEAVTQRRRALRRSWQSTDGSTVHGPTADGSAVDKSAIDKSAASDTEQLRLALRDYRELAERLLRI